VPKGRIIVVAAGACRVALDLPGAEDAITSDEFMELERLPERIVMVGGGYIAAEFSHIAAREGANVTVLQRGAQMLHKFDAELVEWLMEGFRDDNAVTAIERAEEGFGVHTRTPQGTATFRADLVVHAAGRVPDIAELNFTAGTVEVESGRLRVNEYLQSVSNAIVYACGDAAAQGPPLTPVFAANILEGNRHRPDYRGVPSVAFTLPPIAAVGLSEAAARNQAPKLRTNSGKTTDWYTAWCIGEAVYGYKTLIEAESGRIFGAHLVGPHADEVINVFGLAIRHNLTADDLKTTMFAYPTRASDIGYML
jgi:glutathione reductase (NADPH)